MPVTAVIGTQWGDEGKGKVVDVLCERADYVVRFQGGNNAGHTIVVGGETYKLHQVPSGVIHGRAGVIGNGCVIDPQVLLEELKGLRARGLTPTLHLSDRAHLIMPWHKVQDGAEEAAKGSAKIGTTGRGIGPCYSDKAARMGITAGDLRDIGRLRLRLAAALPLKQAHLNALKANHTLDAKAIQRDLEAAAKELAPIVTDTVQLLQEAVVAGQNILLEGAQGAMLDLDHGTYPFVTSSSTAAGGMCSGSGLSPRDIGDVVGVVKAYTTRVGSGPMPTELPLNESVGQHLSEVGKEIGTTTGRQRRCGWLDLVVVNHAVRLCGVNQIAVTKLDVLSGIPKLYVCDAYDLPDSKRTPRVPSDADAFAKAKPIYHEFDGWTDLGDGTWENLPQAARAYLQFIREKTGATMKMVGVGPGRDQTILR